VLLSSKGAIFNFGQFSAKEQQLLGRSMQYNCQYLSSIYISKSNSKISKIPVTTIETLFTLAPCAAQQPVGKFILGNVTF
jgi:hypothetical protein